MKWFKIEALISDKIGIQKLEINRQEICLIKTKDSFYACATKCPHAAADISQGWIEGDQITCPFHRHQYDLTNGRGAEGQGDYLPVYKLEKRPDGWYVNLPESWLRKIFKF
ncbi:MAG: Rieske 2Fe-2S domain-containing protein [Pelobium sp.]